MSTLVIPYAAFCSTASKDVAPPHLAVNSCVQAMQRALSFGKSALYLELAVSVSMFASSSTGADRATKRKVEQVYAEVGFDIAGTDYKTVRRRIDAGAALYEAEGAEAFLKIAEGLAEEEAIEAISVYIGTFQFSGINAVLEYAGKREKFSAPKVSPLIPRMTPSLPSQLRPSSIVTLPSVGGITLASGRLQLEIPLDCSADEALALARRLIDYAGRLPTAEYLRDEAMHS